MALTASDVMTSDVTTVTPATPLSEFARICAEDKISGAPVVEIGGRLAGIVSHTDLIGRLLQEDPFQEPGREFDLPQAAREWREVADIMTPDVLTVAPDAPVEDVAARMARERIHRVLVMKDDDVVGIITSLDRLAHYPGRQPCP